MIDKIDALRKQRGMTVTELCGSAGISRSRYSQLRKSGEQGVSVATIERLLDVLGFELKIVMKE